MIRATAVLVIGLFSQSATADVDKLARMKEAFNTPDQVLECDVKKNHMITVEDKQGSNGLRDIRSEENTKLFIYMKKSDKGFDLTHTPSDFVAAFLNCDSPDRYLTCSSDVSNDHVTYKSRIQLSGHSGSVLRREEKRAKKEYYTEEGRNFPLLRSIESSVGFCKPRVYKHLF